MTALRTVSCLALLALAAALPAACQEPAADPVAAQAALLAGEYDRAIPALTHAVARDGATDADRRALVRALLETGRHADAEAALARFPAGPEWTLARGDLALIRGRLREADSLYRVAADGLPGPRAPVRLGLLLAAQGRWSEAAPIFRRVTAAVRATDRLEAADLAALAAAHRALGVEDPSRFRDALEYYDAAVARDGDDFALRVELGDLFLEKYNRPDALDTYRAVLARNPRHPGALLGSALVAMAEGGGEAPELLRQALEVNPALVPARVALAASHLDREAYDDADRETGRALDANPASLEALTVRATARLFRGDTTGFRAARDQVFAINPRYARFYADLAEQSARNRFYREAADFAARGVALDSASAPALVALGMNQLRIGAMVEGRMTLDRAFALDPYNVWVKNTLDLMDTFSGYASRSSPRFRYYAAPEEIDVLTPYLAELAEEAYDRLAARYGYRPPTPIQVEVYRHHADFSVRTVGLAGLGALGVSFGTVLAMDSPAARPRGEFNWGSTFWHELAHTFTLGATGHRVPRWVSEGLSVLEERRARPGWGAGPGPAFLAAYRDGKLLPVSRLNDGFVRPGYPEQVGYSYYQASLVCEMIEATRGAGAIGAMLRGYRDGWDTPTVFRRVLDAEPERFDREFDRWFRDRFGDRLAATAGEGGGPFRRELEAGLELMAAGRMEDARGPLERAKALFPEYAGPDAPALQLAAVHRAAGRLREAVAELAWFTARAESHYEANLLEADLREQLGDTAGAAAALERAVYIDPRDAALHRRLAERYASLGDWRRVVRERLAVLAMAPTDRADALYRVAEAEYRAGDLAAARRRVLQALEIAPGFERAQDLLLRIREGRP